MAESDGLNSHFVSICIVETCEIIEMRILMSGIVGLGMACAVPSLHPMVSGLRGYCQAQMDCVDGNTEDVKACVVGIQNERRWARQYGCQKGYAIFIDCFKEDSECSDEGEWDLENCHEELDDYLDCLEDESDAYEFGY